VRARATGLPGVVVAVSLAVLGPAVYVALRARRARKRAPALTQ